MTNKAYGFARYAAYEYYHDNSMANNKYGRIRIEAQLEQNMKSANLTIQSPNMEGEFRNIHFNRMVVQGPKKKLN